VTLTILRANIVERDPNKKELSIGIIIILNIKFKDLICHITNYLMST